MRNTRKIEYLAAAFLLAVLNACGGSSSGSGDNSSSDRVEIPRGPIADSNDWEKGVFLPASDFVNRCENPRIGIDSTTGSNYLDMQGTTTDENNWLRSMTNNLYLWYDELPDLDPSLFTTEEYFDLLISRERTSSGAFKDQFHYTIPTEEYYNATRSGISSGYGIRFALISRFPPRELLVAHTQPNSPANDAGITRGAKIIAIDGESVENGDADTLNKGMSPSSIGESHQFTIQDLDSSTTRVVTLTSEEIKTEPVQNVKTISTATGEVGYLTFDRHNAPAEQALIEAIEQLAADNVSDLVLDLRYNNGGFLYIASQLAYMIAGPTRTDNQIFEQLEFNDKHTLVDPVTGDDLEPTPFYSGTTDGFLLPTLNLDRVFVLTGPSTCSASEAIINGLRGVDIDVYQIGSTTCGKPYGFYPRPNCGTSYFTVMFKGTNAKGFGEYSDGFSPQNSSNGFGTLIPGCSVADDFTHLLGDENEKRLAGALNYRAQLESSGIASCDSISSSAKTSGLAEKTGVIDFSAVDAYVAPVKGLEGKILLDTFPKK